MFASNIRNHKEQYKKTKVQFHFHNYATVKITTDIKTR